MEPLFGGHRHHLDGLRRAFNDAHSAANALGAIHLGLGIVIVGDGVDWATLLTHTAGNALFRFNDGAVIRSLRPLRQPGESFPLEYGAATIAAVARANELRRLRAHGESVKRQVNMSHVLEFSQEFGRVLRVQHVFSERGAAASTIHMHLALAKDLIIPFPFYKRNQ